MEFVDTAESWPDKFLSFTLCEILKRANLPQSIASRTKQGLEKTERSGLRHPFLFAKVIAGVALQRTPFGDTL
jgi:hypothetical protein